jgi:hypothetical protein
VERVVQTSFAVNPSGQCTEWAVGRPSWPFSNVTQLCVDIYARSAMSVSDSRRDRVWGSVDRAINGVVRSHLDSDGVQEPFLTDSDGKRPTSIDQVSANFHIQLLF